MRKFIIALFAYSMCVMFGWVGYAAPAKSGQSDEDLIENAIIVDGLSLTADKEMDNDDKDGTVTYDDSFDDGLRIAEKASERKKRGKAGKDVGFIETLKSKDKKWHMTKYEIRKGDTLYGIARKFNTTHKLIIRANSITGPDSLRAGREILVPNRIGVTYSVKRGDTLISISKKYKADQNLISANNNIVRGRMKAGESIFIPDVADKKTAPVERIVKRDQIHKKHVSPDNDDNDESESNKVNDKKISSVKRAFAFMWPLKGRITSGFGTRSDPFSGRRSFHNGIDISAEQGTPVKACADGEVIYSGWKEGYGNLIVLKHDNGYVSVYGHNSELKKSVGETVTRGEVISLSGMTGAVTGAHLHFEIQKYQTPLNPLRMLK